MTVRELRERTGLSQGAFAERFKLNVGTLRTWEQGVRNCPAHVLAMMTEILDREALTSRAGEYVPEKLCPALPVNDRAMLDLIRDYGSYNREKLLARLRELFGEDDVCDNFVSPEYPFPCIYIKSRNLYLEQFDFGQHVGHWYDSGDPNDRMLVDTWSQFLRHGFDDDKYMSAIGIWTELDRAKRWYAAKSRLNYVVFWDPDMEDVNLWFRMNCPDGRDWSVARSWASGLTAEDIVCPRL